MEGRQLFAQSFRPVGLLRDAQLEFIVERESAAVEKFVVHAAEGETVGFHVRAASLMPLVVIRLEGNLH